MYSSTKKGSCFLINVIKNQENTSESFVHYVCLFLEDKNMKLFSVSLEKKNKLEKAEGKKKTRYTNNCSSLNQKSSCNSLGAPWPPNLELMIQICLIFMGTSVCIPPACEAREAPPPLWLCLLDVMSPVTVLYQTATVYFYKYVL